jgi:hypothetical protein
VETPFSWVGRNDHPPDDDKHGDVAGASVMPWFPILNAVVSLLFLWMQKPRLPLVLLQLFPSWIARVYMDSLISWTSVSSFSMCSF